MALAHAMRVVLAGTLAFGAFACARGQQTNKDPNFPTAQGDVALAPNADNATRITWFYDNGVAENQPSVRVAYGSTFRQMSYIGYNEEGAWVSGQDASNRNVTYTIKGNTLTRQPVKVELPLNLKNGAADYREWVGSRARKDSGSAGNNPEPAAGGNPSADTRGRGRIPVIPNGASHPAAVAPDTTAGTDVRIERGASGTTLHYKDASGEHSYKVRRPATASPGVDNVDAGGWVYVAPDGKSGLLLNVSPNHSVSVMPLAQPMLGMLAGHTAN